MTDKVVEGYGKPPRGFMMKNPTGMEGQSHALTVVGGCEPQALKS